MQMKTLTINDQAFIIVDAEAMRKLADSDLNMKGKLIYDAIIHANKLSFPGLNQDELVEVVSGSVEQGVPMLVFSGHDEGSMPVLRNIHDGIEDSDAATVGQVKAVEETAVKKNTEAVVSSIKILHTPETSDAIGVIGSVIKDKDDFAVNALTFVGDFEGEQIDTGAVILRGIHDGINKNDVATVGQVNVAQQIAEDAYVAVGSAVIVNPQTLTAEQKAQVRANIGALSNGDDPLFVGLTISDPDSDSGARICPEPHAEDGDSSVAVLSFYGALGDEPTILRNINNGINDDDAATVGQVKAVEKAAVKKNADASVSSLKILHSPETMDAIGMVGSLVHDASDLVVTVLTILGDAEGEQIDTNTTILRGIHKGEEPFDAVNKAQLDEAIANAIANLPVYNGEVEEV